MNIEVMIARRQAGIRRAVELMADPVGQLPAPIRWAAWLTCTADYLQAFLRWLMRKRVDRLRQECRFLDEIAELHCRSGKPSPDCHQRFKQKSLLPFE